MAAVRQQVGAGPRPSACLTSCGGRLTREKQLELLDNDGFPDWDYMPPGPKEPFEYKEGDWGYLDGRFVLLDYAGGDRDD